MKRLIAVVVAFVLPGALLLGGSALAGGSADRAEEVESRLTLKVKDRPNSERIRFSGEIKSKEGECESNRRVRLERRGAGKIATTRTTRRGIYRFKIARDELPKGRYEVVARRKKVTADDGERITCERGLSRSEKIVSDTKPDRVKFDTDITLELTRGSQGDQYTPPGKARYSGRVRSQSDLCIGDREVRIHERGANNFGVVVFTDAQGNYSLEVDEPLDPGEYRARAERRIIEERNGDTTTCRPGRSNIVRVP